MKKDDLTAEELRRVLSYDPTTGVFRWRVSTARCVKPGDIAGSWREDGYWCVVYRRFNYNAQRLAHLYMVGEWPLRHVDHEDLDKGNNRWVNLRPANRSQNGANRRLLSNNTSGFKGVSWHAKIGKWQAYLTVDGRRHYLGYFISSELASAAYMTEAVKCFGEFARAA